ncbi:MAG TPA: nucleoside deaminase [Desulfobulbaceae bacterium]|nr:nucleoside deaminase [Desulfobulbaceae bacterium]
MVSYQDDEQMMKLALIEAQAAADLGEVPVGAVLVSDGEIIARAGNNLRANVDPAGHAEIRALRRGARYLDNYRLPGTVLYVTLEPCAMCAAAMVHARIARLVFGAVDPKGGGVVSRYRIGRDGRLNHDFEVTAGVLAEKCGHILKEFFQKRR